MMNNNIILKKNIALLVLLGTLSSCGNYEEFKEDFQAGFTGIQPGQELSFQILKDEVLTPRCTTCHSKYGEYQNVKANINAIVGMVRANVMPKDGPLNDQQKGLLFTWVNAGMPEFSSPPNPAPAPTPNPGPNPAPGPSPIPTPLPPQERLTFANLSQKVFKPNCIQCHGAFNDYVNVKNKINAIVNMVRTDAMPIGNPLTLELKTLLFDWAAAGVPQDDTGPTPVPNPNPIPTPPPTPIPLGPSYQSLNHHVFSKKCIACHNPTGRAAFLDLSTYEAITRNSSRLFDFRRPERSDIIEEILDNERPMPPVSSPFAQVTSKEVQALIEWIRNRVPNN